MLFTAASNRHRLRHRALTTLASAHDYVELVRRASGDSLWVFAYGSLMWSAPEGVSVADRVRCRLQGHARSFCIHSRNYRGTPAAPGLVLGLQPAEGAACEGVALGLGHPDSGSALDALGRIDAQEMITQSNPTDVYLRTIQTLLLGDGRSVQALAFVANPADSPATDLTLQQRAEVIVSRSGSRGSNREYLEQTADRLLSLGIRDDDVQDLRDRVRALARGKDAEERESENSRPCRASVRSV